MAINDSWDSMIWGNYGNPVNFDLLAQIAANPSLYTAPTATTPQVSPIAGGQIRPPASPYVPIPTFASLGFPQFDVPDPNAPPPVSAPTTYDPATTAQASDGRWYGLAPDGSVQMLSDSADSGKKLGLTPGPKAPVTLAIVEPNLQRLAQQASPGSVLKDIAGVVGPFAGAILAGGAMGGGLSGLMGGGGITSGVIPAVDTAIPTAVSAAESALPAAVASAPDAISAIDAAMTATGASTASEAATALGFTSPEALVGAVNPAWAAGAAAVGGAVGGITAGQALSGAGAAATAAGAGGGGQDKVGSDWATGQATGPAGGLLPADPNTGLTLPNFQASPSGTDNQALNDFIASQGGTFDNIAPGTGTASDAPGVPADLLSRIMDGSATAADLLKAGLPLAGAALGATNGAKQAGTTTTVQDLPDWLKPYVTGNLDAAKSYMAANPQNNSLIGPASGQLSSTINGDYLNSNPANAGFQAAQGYVNPAIAALSKGASGSFIGLNPADAGYKAAQDYTNTSMDYLRPTASGAFLNKNPYIDALYQQAANPLVANIDSQFTKAGRYGSGAQQGVLGTTLGNLATNIYGQNYANERQNMLTAGQALTSADLAQQAARLAGTTGLSGNYNTERTLQSNYAQAQSAAEQAQQAARLAGTSGLAGTYNTARGQQLTAATSAPGFTSDAATAPFAAFNAFGNLTKGLGVSQTTSPYFTNPTGGALSGALAGYGLSKAFG